MQKKPEIKVRHKLLKKNGKILMRHFKGIPDECFNIRIFLEGDIDTLKKVEYELHPSFYNPLRAVENPKGGFPLDIWTWGEFDITVTFYYKDGSVSDSVFSLAYSDELPASDKAYIDITPDSLKRAL